LQAGIFTSTEQLQSLWQSQQHFYPSLNQADRERYYQGWQQAVRRLQSP